TARDTATTQHMTTFTLGLGVSGTVMYEANYETAPNISNKTQYYDILNGTADWPNPTTDPAKIDDLWHAAVNGRGVYYSASDPNSLVRGLSDALSGISARVGSATAAATSSLEPVAGDNAIYLARYRTVKWDGELLAKTIDPNTGAIASTATWNTQAKLDTQVSSANSGDGRTIKYFKSSASNSNYLKDFTFTNLNGDGLGSSFTNACSSTSPAPLSQCANLTAAQQLLADSGDNLVNYLRGQSTYEAAVGATNPLYRDREHVLGDVVNAVPVYVKKPQFNYEQYDLTYGTFKSDNTTRLASVYLAANDGMLHAINADDGTERWAFVPSFVMSNMRQLADSNYAHRYYVDGSPTAADICTSPTTATSTTPSGCSASSGWKTIVIGGLNKGGCGYYALDVTDPASPKGLWEFTNANLGYSFGNPVVTRRSDGKWVVLVTSGYNNIPGTCGKGANVGDGQGHLFVLDAATGTLLDDISTGVGTSSAPSNLGKLNVWVENAQLNTADAAYAGDMLGNVWRFDFDNKYGATGKDAFLLATLKDPSGNAQPITVKPELAYLKNSRIVMVGTGKLLATSDLNDEQVQSLYGLKDDLTATSGIGDPRSSANSAVVKARTLTSLGSNQLTLSGSDINWATDKGWYLDFITEKERVNVEMQLQYNTLTVATNVPESNACTAGGYSWLYYLDISTGKYLPTSLNSMVGYRLGNNALVAGIRTVKLQNGKTITVVTDSLGDSRVENAPTSSSGGGSGARRTMWREIQD
ncbi:MAG TPA: PilC/PilY family type IV pilus protein, partial [Aquabacterium sp.]|nr:PilC/PilY family type IV pilus protein [Aquabacterium sp.]